MKSDIQIAQEASMLPIQEVASSLGIREDELELYGKYKAKLSDELMEDIKVAIKNNCLLDFKEKFLARYNAGELKNAKNK